MKKFTSDAYYPLDNIRVASSTKDASLKLGIQARREENVGKERRHSHQAKR